MSPEVAALIGAGAALIGSALGFAGSVAVAFVQDRHLQRAWLRGKQSKLYERIVAQVVGIVERKG